MEFQGNVLETDTWILNTQLPNVVANWEEHHSLPKELCDIWGLILSTAKGEEKGGGAPLKDHALQFTVSEEPELLGTTD